MKPPPRLQLTEIDRSVVRSLARQIAMRVTPPGEQRERLAFDLAERALTHHNRVK